MNRKQVRVRVPASTANLGPGFDTLGMALELYAWIDMAESEQTRIHLYGSQMEGIPADKSNLVYQVAQQVFQQAGVVIPELEIAMYSEIPLTRGLGSSAAAIVGALAAANALIGNQLSDDELFQIATKLEDHPDNVGASLYGGIVAAYWDGVRAEYIRIEPSEQLEVLVAIPEFHLATEKARHVLPKQVSLQDAVFNVSHAALLVASLGSGRFDLIGKAMKDRLHQPYRSAMIPGMDKILNEAMQHGALGVALSGAGPTMIAFIDREQADRNKELESFLLHTFGEAQVNAQTMWLRPSRQGVQMIHPDDRDYTIFDTLKGEVRA